MLTFKSLFVKVVFDNKIVFDFMLTFITFRCIIKGAIGKISLYTLSYMKGGNAMYEHLYKNVESEKIETINGKIVSEVVFKKTLITQQLCNLVSLFTAQGIRCAIATADSGHMMLRYEVSASRWSNDHTAFPWGRRWSDSIRTSPVFHFIKF